MKDKIDFNPERMLWMIVVTNIILIVLFLVVISLVYYVGQGSEILN